MDILLYQPITPRQQQQQAASNADSNETAHVYPGLSLNSIDIITNNRKVTWTSQKLADAKVGDDNFLFLICIIFLKNIWFQNFMFLSFLACYSSFYIN